MKTRSPLIPILALATISLATALVFAQQKLVETGLPEQNIKKAVLETNAKMIQAANRMDVESFFSFILDEGSIVQNGRVFKSRQEAMKTVEQGFAGIAKLDRQFTNPQVTVVSPDVALLTSEGSVNASLADGRTVQGSFAVSLVFVRKEGQWKVLHGHYSVPANI